MNQQHRETDFLVYVHTKPDPSNAGYHHPTHNSEMHICKDGVEITLTSEEIKQVVSAAGGTFRR